MGRRMVAATWVATLLAFVALGAASCGGSEPSPSPSPSASSSGSSPDTPAPARPAKAVARSGGDSPLSAPLWDFGLDLLARQAGKTGDDVVVSPVSLNAVLSMALNGARGETAAQMEHALRLDALGPQQANQAWADLIAASNETERAEVRIADSLWLRDGVDYVPDFLAANRDYFAADALGLPPDLSQAPAEINGWISERTGGRIKDLISSVPPETALILVNTVYAKVGWEVFDAEATQPRPFTLADGTSVDVPTMQGGLTAQVAVAEEYVAVPIETNGELVLWVIVPKGAETPESVAKLLRRRGPDSLRASGSAARVTLELPRFKVEYRSEKLRDDLEAMGMRDAFSPRDADFSGMADLDALWVDDVLQKVMMDVNEEGVEAAAASAAVMAGTALIEKTMTVRADRPFFAVLAGTTTDAPLFMALVRDPR